MQSLNQKINESKKELLRMRKESPMAAERNRANILLALNSGLSKAAVARTLAHARSTVIAAAQGFEAHGVAGCATTAGRRQRGCLGAITSCRCCRKLLPSSRKISAGSGLPGRWRRSPARSAHRPAPK